MTQTYIGVKMVTAWPETRDGVEMAAKAAHEANRRYCQSLGDDSQPKWANAPQWQKDSAMAGVRAIVADPNLTPEGSHQNWMALKSAEGWTYGLVKDVAKKQHPCMVPFEQLPAEHQAKDDLFINTVKQSLAKYPPVAEGYAVKYEDGYVSWSPKAVFEAAYLPMGFIETADGKVFSNENMVTPAMVEAMMGKTYTRQLGDKTTLVVADTLTGFRQVEASSCVDPQNFDLNLGAEIASKRIQDSLWKCLGFVLQWARFGLKHQSKPPFGAEE